MCLPFSGGDGTLMFVDSPSSLNNENKRNSRISNAAENIWKLKFFKRIGMKRKVVHNGKRAYVECLTVDHGFCVKCYLYRTSIEFISMQTV